MEAALTIISGGETLRNTLDGAAGVEGAFYNWPVRGEQLTMFICNGEDQLSTLTTSKVTRVYAQTDISCEFECVDGRFRLNKLSNKDGMLAMENNLL